MPYHTPGSGNPGMMGGKSKRKPYMMKKSSTNTGENEHTGINSNPTGTGKEQENAKYLDTSKSQFPKNKSYVGKNGIATY